LRPSWTFCRLARLLENGRCRRVDGAPAELLSGEEDVLIIIKERHIHVPNDYY
jgi:hypothetical protein